MRLRHLLAVLALVCAQPAYAANTVDWVDAFSGEAYDETRQLHPGGCVAARFDTDNEGSESKLLYVGGVSITVAADGDAEGAGTGSGDLYSCTRAASTSCAAQDLVPGGTNRLDGVTARGTLTPLTVPGWLYVDPDAATINDAEVFEVVVCAVR